MNQRGGQPNSPGVFQPKKSLGQHFLWQKKVLAKIIEAADLESTDFVLEVGPGEGALTKELAKKTKKVIAVEKDPRLIPILQINLKEFHNIKLIGGDVLTLHPKPYTLSPYKLVANLPYYAATHIIRRFLELKNKPKLMVLMVQKEVGQRICAKPPKMNLLAVSVQFYAEPKIVAFVPRAAFWPRPKVDSAIIKLKTQSEKRKVDEKLFFKIARAGFSQPRKQLSNNFVEKLNCHKEKVGAWLLENKINLQCRAESLSLDDWLALAKTFMTVLQ